MKKLTLFVAVLMISGATFAQEKSCCKKKGEKCSKESGACCKDKKGANKDNGKDTKGTPKEGPKETK